jgi:dienelactone hydrolase
MRPSIPAVVAACLLAGCAAPEKVQPHELIPPVGRGAYQVGSTHFAIRDLPSRDRHRHLCGRTSRGKTWYVDSILQHPEAVPFVTTKPGIRAMRSYYVVLYPTPVSNMREDHAVADTYRLPHMQGYLEKPILPDGQRYPLVIFSHGWHSHPFYDVRHLVTLASHGYVVAALCHGDKRFGRSPSTPKAHANRWQGVRALIDGLQKDAFFRDPVDFKRVGVFGISMGGWTAVSLIGGTQKDVSRFPDTRIRAAFAESPALFAFQKEHGGGVDNVRVPFFSLLGGDDEVGDIAAEVIRGMKGPVYAVTLPGQGHVPSDRAKELVRGTWLVHFFNAYLKEDPESRRILGIAKRVDCPVRNLLTMHPPRRPPVAPPEKPQPKQEPRSQKSEAAPASRSPSDPIPESTGHGAWPADQDKNPK